MQISKMTVSPSIGETLDGWGSDTFFFKNAIQNHAKPTKMSKRRFLFVYIKKKQYFCSRKSFELWIFRL